MSGYEKPQQAYVYGYTPTKPSQEQSYAGPIQPSFDQQYSTTHVDESHALVATHQMPFLGASFEPRDTGYQPSNTPLIDVRSRSSPEITSPGPYSGRPGEYFRLGIRSTTDYSSRPILFFILFGNTAARASISNSLYRDPFYHYTIQVQVPPLANTNQTQHGNMPLLLDIQDENGHSMSMKSLDSFTYLDASPFSRYAVPLEVPKKRKYAEETPEHSLPAAKRSASSPLHPRSQSTLSPASVANSYNFDSGGLYALPTVYDQPMAHQRAYMPAASQRPGTGLGGSPTVSGTLKARSPSFDSYSSYSVVGRSGPNPRMAVPPQHPRSQGSASSASGTNPPLIRTSILQPQQSSFRTPGFNPYTIYPSAKAKLEIQGDLMHMANRANWTEEEKKVQRRLVEFSRRQEDSVIHASFKSVSLEERTQGANCVSCIFWEERGECFVTSVDTIQLLEGLVGVRFTVEEKNRIRRNLEGFKPLTVSKQKEDSESFFRLIMGFPNPKPRNIEKDVKVFPWSILSNALRKIIGKYSASYASTSAVLAPSTTAPFVTTLPDPSVDHLPTVSPQSCTSSSTSRGYPARAAMPGMPGTHHGQVIIETTTGNYESSRHTSQPISTMSPWGGQYSSVDTPSQYTPGHGPHSNRSSWDMGTFTDQQQIPGGPSQRVHYYTSGTSNEHAHSGGYHTHGQAHN